MGQKANPISLQVGNKTGWKTEFAEKKIRDVGTVNYYEVQSINIISKFFKNYNFVIQDYRIYFQENSIHFFLAIFSIPNAQLSSTPINNKYKKNNIILKTNCANKNLALPVKNIFRTVELNTLIHILTKFFKKKTISLNISYTNKYLNLSSENMHKAKKSFLTLRRFKKRNFFIEVFNNNFALSKNKCFSTILLKSLLSAIQNKKIKNLKPLLKFIQKSLEVLIENPNYKTSGIKIKIKGRLNKAPRTKNYILTVGSVPCHSLKTKLKYESGSIQNSTGSYGVKLWVVGDF